MSAWHGHAPRCSKADHRGTLLLRRSLGNRQHGSGGEYCDESQNRSRRPLRQRVRPKGLASGAGYIGLELGTAFRKLGSEVTIIEAFERILPNWDEPLTNPVRRWLVRAGVTLHLGATVE